MYIFEFFFTIFCGFVLTIYFVANVIYFMRNEFSKKCLIIFAISSFLFLLNLFHVTRYQTKYNELVAQNEMLLENKIETERELIDEYFIDKDEIKLNYMINYYDNEFDNCIQTNLSEIKSIENFKKFLKK